MADGPQIDLMRERITDEIFFALGLKKRGIIRRIFGRPFYVPTNRFAQMFAEADKAVGRDGLPAGCRVVRDHLRVSVQSSGVENLDCGGPLMVLSNHPGAYDSVAIGSLIPRKDLRIIVYEIPFYHALPQIGPRLIYVPDDPAGRMVALRTAIQHLQNGGALLQFGAGTIEPDPAVQPGAVEMLQHWSPSVEIMLRKAPETCVVLAAASGVLLPRFFNHPIARLRRQPVARRRLAEFMQVLTQLASPNSVQAEAHIRFAPPVPVADLFEQEGGDRLMSVLIQAEHRLLADEAAAHNLLL